MKKIKEKPTLSECIKEKAVSTPRELLRKGLDDGSERLRTQLRDTAQHGQADEYGGDTIEDTAARGLRRAEKELTPAAEEETAEQPPKGRRSCCRCHRAKAFCYQGKRYHFCRVAAAERCGAWMAAGAPERSAKGRQGQDKRYLYRRTDRDTGHSGSGTAAAGAESIHGGTRAQSCPMAGRAKASRIAPPNQDGTSLTFRQGRQRHARQNAFGADTAHQRTG